MKESLDCPSQITFSSKIVIDKRKDTERSIKMSFLELETSENHSMLVRHSCCAKTPSLATPLQKEETHREEHKRKHAGWTTCFNGSLVLLRHLQYLPVAGALTVPSRTGNQIYLQGSRYRCFRHQSTAHRNIDNR